MILFNKNLRLVSILKTLCGDIFEIFRFMLENDASYNKCLNFKATKFDVFLTTK